MNPFQIIILFIILLIFFLVTRSQVQLLERILTIFIIIVGVIFLLNPNLTTRLANLVGIGRGSDLVFYLFIIYGIFWFSIISNRLRLNDRKITKIIRANAISNPYFGPNQKKTNSNWVAKKSKSQPLLFHEPIVSLTDKNHLFRYLAKAIARDYQQQIELFCIEYIHEYGLSLLVFGAAAQFIPFLTSYFAFAIDTKLPWSFGSITLACMESFWWKRKPESKQHRLSFLRFNTLPILSIIIYYLNEWLIFIWYRQLRSIMWRLIV